MKTYLVTIQARVTKTLEIEAETEAEAIEQAHEEFTCECTDFHEDYQQETVSVNDRPANVQMPEVAK